MVYGALSAVANPDPLTLHGIVPLCSVPLKLATPLKSSRVIMTVSVGPWVQITPKLPTRMMTPVTGAVYMLGPPVAAPMSQGKFIGVMETHKALVPNVATETEAGA